MDAIIFLSVSLLLGINLSYKRYGYISFFCYNENRGVNMNENLKNNQTNN